VVGGTEKASGGREQEAVCKQTEENSREEAAGGRESGLTKDTK